MANNEASYKPSAYYWRNTIRAATSKKQLREIAMALVEELEEHKAEFRRHGIVPPKKRVCASEASAKPRIAPLVQPMF